MIKVPTASRTIPSMRSQFGCLLIGVHLVATQLISRKPRRFATPGPHDRPPSYFSNLGKPHRYCGPETGSRGRWNRVERPRSLAAFHQESSPCTPRARVRTAATRDRTRAFRPTQAQALDRRHVLDEQQRAYQGTHEAIRPTEPATAVRLPEPSRGSLRPSGPAGPARRRRRRRGPTSGRRPA